MELACQSEHPGLELAPETFEGLWDLEFSDNLFPSTNMAVVDFL